ncbi:MAG: sugar phosphate isomerase/epimerase, partial [Lentisphaeria bacterium]|nr:sugar phosphate isomerase/epimerase [Lentisphaeria bacterium]
YVRRSIEKLLPTAVKNNIVLALENGSETPEQLQKMIALADEFDSEQLGFCFDTGHANCYGTKNVNELRSLMSSRIAVLHLHDNHGSFDDHNPPGGGNIDWTDLVPRLKSLPKLRNPETESGDWSRESWESFKKMWNL